MSDPRADGSGRHRGRSDRPAYTPAMSVFSDTFTGFIEAFFELEPVAATAIGDHRHDGRWPDRSPAAHDARLAFVDAWEATFSDLDPATLSRDEAIDRDLVLGELEAMRFGEPGGGFHRVTP